MVYESYKMYEHLSEEVRSFIYHRLLQKQKQGISFAQITRSYLEKVFPYGELPEPLPLKTYWIDNSGIQVAIHRTTIRDSNYHLQSFWSFQKFDEALIETIQREMEYPPYNNSVEVEEIIYDDDFPF